MKQFRTRIQYSTTPILQSIFMADITLTIDGAPVTVPAGTTILKAAEQPAGIFRRSAITITARQTGSAVSAWSKSTA